MSRRLVIITEIISPYRLPLFNALAQRADVDLHVIFLAETDPGLRQWKVYKEDIEFSYQVLPSWRTRIGGYNALLNIGIGHALTSARPDVILCGGYSYVASWQALLWARRRGTPFFLWSESNLQDLRPGHAMVEFLKNEFLRQCSGFVVPGRTAREYLRFHKIREDVIFRAVNAVDNDLFASASAAARRDAVQFRASFGLPNRYFLFAGRLVREKGVFELLSAYAKLEEALREQIGLVFVGDGAARQALETESSLVDAGSNQIRRLCPAGAVSRLLRSSRDVDFAHLHGYLGIRCERSHGLRLTRDCEPGRRMRRGPSHGELERSNGSPQGCAGSDSRNEKSGESAGVAWNTGHEQPETYFRLFTSRMVRRYC